MNKSKLYVRQICFLFGAFTLPLKLVTVPAIAAKQAAEGLWISVAINFISDGAAVFLICLIAKKFEGMTIFEIIENKFGKNGKTIFSFLFSLFFILKAYLPLIEHRNFIEIALYETTPALWIFLPIFLFSAFFSYKGLRGIGRAADVSIWFTVAGIIVVCALSVSVADFSNLLPLKGIAFENVFSGSVKTSLWFFDSPYLLFCLGHFKPEKRQTAKITGAYFGFAAIAIIYIVILRCEFGPLTERQFFSPMKMGKYSVSVSNIGRIDYIAVCAIIFSSVFGCAMPLVFSTMCLEKSFPFRHKASPCLTINAVIALVILLTEDYYFTIRDFFSAYVIPAFAVLSALPLALLFFGETNGKKPPKTERKCAF